EIREGRLERGRGSREDRAGDPVGAGGGTRDGPRWCEGQGVPGDGSDLLRHRAVTEPRSTSPPSAIRVPRRDGFLADGRLTPAGSMPAPIHVVWYTDPHNIWCWGCEPMVRRLQVVYPEAVEVEVRMGGLFEAFTPV